MEKPPKSLSFLSASQKKIANSMSPTKSSNYKSQTSLTKTQNKLKKVIHNINPKANPVVISP